MLFWIFVVVTIVAAVKIFSSYFSNNQFTAVIYWGGLVVSGSCLALILLFHIPSKSLEITPEYYEKVYEDISYKIENGYCRNNRGKLSENMINEINEYNNGLEFCQKYERDFWVGIFLPNRYDTLQTISLEQVNQPVGKKDNSK